MRKFYRAAIAVISIILVIGIVLMFFLFTSGNSGNMGIMMLILDILAAGCLAAIVILKKREDRLEEVPVECPTCKSKEIEKLAGIEHEAGYESNRGKTGKEREYHCSNCGSMWRRKV